MANTQVVCCDEIQGRPVSCACQEDAPITPCSLLVVCCIEYVGVNDAWQKTGIPPHKLRFMASSVAFPGVYWS